MAKSNPGGGGKDNSKKYGEILKNGMKVGKTYSVMKPDKLYSGKVLRVDEKMNRKLKKK